MLTRVGLVAVGAAAIGFVLVRDPYSPLGPSLAAMGVAFGALALLVALELRRSRLDTRVVAVAGAGLLVLAVVVPPLQSRDMWSYAMYGRMVAHYHASPYEHVPAEWPHDPWTLRVAHGWRGTRSVYGPAFTAFSAAGMAVLTHSFLGVRLFFQISAALAVAAAGWLVARNTRGAPALALLLLNPLVVVSVVNGAHNDAFVGLAVIGGVLLAARARPGWAGAVLAVGALVKAAAALPLLAVALWVWRRHGRRAAAQLVTTAAAIGVVAYVVAGGLDGLRPLHEAGLDFSGASIWYAPRRWVSATLRHQHSATVAAHDARVMLSAGAAVFVAALAFVLVRRRLHLRTPAVAAGAAAFAYALGGAYVLPWYAYWGLPALAMAWRSRLTWLVAVHGAVLYLAQVPDLTANPGVNRLFVASELQRFRSDVYLIWLPLTDAVVIIVLLATSLRPRRPSDEPAASYDSALLPALGSESVPAGSSPLSARS